MPASVGTTIAPFYQEAFRHYPIAFFAQVIVFSFHAVVISVGKQVIKHSHGGWLVVFKLLQVMAHAVAFGFQVPLVVLVWSNFNRNGFGNR